MNEKYKELKEKIVEITTKMSGKGIPNSIINEFLKEMDKLGLQTYEEIEITSQENNGMEEITISTKHNQTREDYTVKINPTQRQYDVNIHEQTIAGTLGALRIVKEERHSKTISFEKNGFVISSDEEFSYEQDEQNRKMQHISTQIEHFYDQTGVEMRSKSQIKESKTGDITKTETTRVSPDLLEVHTEKYPGGYMQQQPEVTKSYSILRGENGSLANFNQSENRNCNLSNYYINQTDFEQKTQNDTPEQQQFIIDTWGRQYNLISGKSR